MLRVVSAASIREPVRHFTLRNEKAICPQSRSHLRDSLGSTQSLLVRKVCPPLYCLETEFSQLSKIGVYSCTSVEAKEAMADNSDSSRVNCCAASRTSRSMFSPLSLKENSALILSRRSKKKMTASACSPAKLRRNSAVLMLTLPAESGTTMIGRPVWVNFFAALVRIEEIFTGLV